MTTDTEIVEEARHGQREAEVEAKLEEVEQRALSLWERVFGRHEMEHQLRFGDLLEGFEDDEGTQ